MKKFQLVIRVLVVTLFCISFTPANSQTNQQATTSGSIMRVNKAKIKSNFLKDLLSIFVDFPSNSEAPFLTTQDFQEKAWIWKSIVDYPKEVVHTVMTRQKLEKAYPKDCMAVPLIATKGDFVIVCYMSESNYHEMISQWLITYDYNGNRIDSLEFARGMGLDDLSSRLNQDLTINQTFIDWGDAAFDFSNFYSVKSHKGTRLDIKYSITSSGHFQRTGCLRYESKIYNVDDLRTSSPNAPQRGIHLGKERPIGVCTLQENEEDRKNNRFPIYGHYTGTN